MQNMSDYENSLQDRPPRTDSANSHPSSQPRPSTRPGLEPIPVFDQADSVTIQLEILRETHDELLRMLGENEWDPDEGLRTILTTGLGYLAARQRLEGINTLAAGGSPEAAARINAMMNDLATYHSMYSVMKFKAFKLYKVNQVLDFNIAGLRATEEMWEGWANRMRLRQAELEAEVAHLRALLSEFQTSSEPPTLDEPAFMVAPDEDYTRQMPGGTERFQPEAPAFRHTNDATQKPKLTLWERLKRLLAG